MATIPDTGLLTADEFETISDQFGSCELFRGRIVEMSPAGFPHSRVTSRVTYLLEDWAKRNKKGRVIAGEAGVVVESDPDTVRGADVAYYSFERLPLGSEPRGFLKTPPNLVVEVQGSDRKAWGEILVKVGEYLRFGVDSVWVIDIDAGSVHVYGPNSAPIVLRESDTIAIETVLPGFACQVSQFLED
jgi:Uma2 family endonuclease